MADAYKGLTVQIGGDTTRLVDALKQATRAAADTQRQLRQLDAAARIDPEGISSAETRLRLMGESVQDAGLKLSKLKEAMAQLGSERVDGKSVERLASETENAGLQAQLALKRYNDLNSALGHMYLPLNEAANASDKFRDALLDAGARAEAAGADVSGLNAVIDALAEKRFRLQDVFQLDGTAFEATKDAIAAMGDEWAAMVPEIERMRSRWQDAFGENETAKKVEGFKRLGTEAEALGSTIAATSAKMEKLRGPSDLAKGFQDTEQTVRSADKAVESLVSRAESLGRALKVDPKNVSAATERVEALQQAVSIASSKAEELRERLSKYEAAGVDKAASSMADVTRNAEEANRQWARSSAELAQAKAELDDLVSAAKSAGDAAGMSSTRYEEAARRVDEARERVDRLAQAEAEANSARDKARMAEEYVELKQAVADADAQVAELQDTLSGGKMNFGEAMSGLGQIGAALSATLTSSLVEFGQFAMDAARETDSAYRDMRKTVDGTEKDFERLKQSAIDFSTTHVTSAAQVLEIQAIGGELGVATDALDTFAETVSNLDVATNLGAEDAATVLGTLSNIMGDLSESRMPQFADALVRLGNNGASTESQIADIAQRIGSMSSILGMSTPDVLAWASTIASTGQNVEAAGTAISNTMSDIETAVSSGGSSLQGFADVSRMTAEDFAATWESDPTQALKAFIEGLKVLEENNVSADATLGSLGINASRQKQAIMGLMQTIDMLDDNLQMSNDAWDGVSDKWGEAGDAANEAGKKAEGLSGALSRIENSASNMGASLGDAVAPLVSDVADALGDLSEWLDSTDDGFKRALVGAGAFLAAIGPGLTMASTMGKGLEHLTGALNDYGASAMAAGKLGGKFLATLTVPKTLGIVAAVTAAIAVVGAVASEFQKARKNAENFEKATDGLSDAVADTKALSDFEGTIQDIGTSSDFSAKSLDELSESIASSVDRMNENTDAAERQISQLNAAQGVLHTYAGQTDLTAEAQGKLQWAIQLLNDQLGTSITLQDVQNGQYVDADGNVQDLISSIDSLIAKKKEEARLNAATANLTEAYESQTEAAKTLAKAQKDYNDQIEYYKKFGWSDEKARGKIKDTRYQDDLDKARQQYDATTEAVRALEEETGNAALAASDAADAFDTWGSNAGPLLEQSLASQKKSLSGLKDDMRALGASTEDLGRLSEDQLLELADAYDGTTASIVGKLAEWNVGMDETARKNAEATEGMRERLQQFASDANGALDGVDITAFADKLAQAGVSTEQLNAIGSENFAALAANCGGSLETLIFMLQNYNGTPIYDKDGNITVDQAQLIDAQGNVYTWNGSSLQTLQGEAVVSYDSLELANDAEYEWNSSGQLTDKSGNIVVDTTQIELANGEVVEWNGQQLKDLDGNIVIESQQLTDCLGNVAEYQGTELKPLKGNVYCDYSELTEAMNAIGSFRKLDGTTITTNVRTNKTTTVRTVNLPTKGGSSAGQSPASLAPVSALSASTAALASAQGAALMSARAAQRSSSAMRSDFAAGAIVNASESKYPGGASLQAVDSSTHISVYLNDVAINQDEAIENNVLGLLADLKRRGDL